MLYVLRRICSSGQLFSSFKSSYDDVHTYMYVCIQFDARVYSRRLRRQFICNRSSSQTQDEGTI